MADVAFILAVGQLLGTNSFAQASPVPQATAVSANNIASNGTAGMGNTSVAKGTSLATTGIGAAANSSTLGSVASGNSTADAATTSAAAASSSTSSKKLAIYAAAAIGGIVVIAGLYFGYTWYTKRNKRDAEPDAAASRVTQSHPSQQRNTARERGYDDGEEEEEDDYSDDDEDEEKWDEYEEKKAKQQAKVSRPSRSGSRQNSSRSDHPTTRSKTKKHATVEDGDDEEMVESPEEYDEPNMAGMGTKQRERTRSSSSREEGRKPSRSTSGDQGRKGSSSSQGQKRPAVRRRESDV